MLSLKAKIWPVDFLMSFECNDERMNNIWNASVLPPCIPARTAFIWMVSRESYLPWSMDAVLSTFAGDYLLEMNRFRATAFQ